MLKRKLTQGDLFLIAANLVPVYGVWFLGWNAVEAFIVYAMETLIVGMITLLKMAVVTVYRRTDTWYNRDVSTQVSGLPQSGEALQSHYTLIIIFLSFFHLCGTLRLRLTTECTEAPKPPKGGL